MADDPTREEFNAAVQAVTDSADSDLSEDEFYNRVEVEIAKARLAAANAKPLQTTTDPAEARRQSRMQDTIKGLWGIPGFFKDLPSDLYNMPGIPTNNPSQAWEDIKADPWGTKFASNVYESMKDPYTGVKTITGLAMGHPRVAPRIPRAMTVTGEAIDTAAGKVANTPIARGLALGAGGGAGILPFVGQGQWSPWAMGAAALPYATQIGGKILAGVGRYLGGDQPYVPPRPPGVNPPAAAVTTTAPTPTAAPILTQPSGGATPGTVAWSTRTPPPQGPVVPGATGTGSAGPIPQGPIGWTEPAPPTVSPEPPPVSTSTGTGSAGGPLPTGPVSWSVRRPSPSAAAADEAVGNTIQQQMAKAAGETPAAAGDVLKEQVATEVAADAAANAERVQDLANPQGQSPFVDIPDVRGPGRPRIYGPEPEPRPPGRPKGSTKAAAQPEPEPAASGEGSPPATKPSWLTDKELARIETIIDQRTPEQAVSYYKSIANEGTFKHGFRLALERRGIPID